VVESQYFLVETRGHVRAITMTNSSKHNSFNAVMSSELIRLMNEAVEDGIRVVLLRAEPGVKVWSAGHDISELPTGQQDPLVWTNTLARMADAVAAFPLPLIAVVEGGVWGGASELTMSADLVIAHRDSTFAITPAKLGVAYSSGGISRFMAALPSHIVKEMFFTAEPLSATRAYELGAVNRLAEDHEELTTISWELAEKIAQRAPLTLRSAKAEAGALSEPAHSDDQAAQLQELRDAAWTSDDYHEGLAAFGQRRPPKFQGR
jgi:methylmalonyl-CoA decarboxylase